MIKLFEVNQSRDFFDSATAVLGALGLMIQAVTLYVVALYTRTTQKLLEQAQTQNNELAKQNLNAQIQIDLTRDQMEVDKKERIQEGRPVILWNTLAGIGRSIMRQSQFQISFTNLGCAFSILESRSIGIKEISISPLIVNRGERGTVTIAGWEPRREIIFFGIEIITEKGERKNVVFKLEGDGNPVDICKQTAYSTLGDVKRTTGVTELA
jgi:hypothetical protein